MIWIYRTLIAALVIYLTIMAVVFFAQRGLMYFPPNIYDAPPDRWNEVRADDGTLGWHLPAREGQLTVIVFHGNASAIDSNMHIFRDLRTEGYGIWSVGYPGYPGNDGKPTQAAITQAARSQVKALRGLGVEKVVFYGTSLGAAVAAQVAAKVATNDTPALLILDAPFNSMADMTRMHMPLLPTRLLLKDHWRSDAALATLDIPLIWIHGTDDRIVPLSQGQKLFEGYNGPRSGHVIPGAHHTNTWMNGGREIVLEALSER